MKRNRKLAACIRVVAAICISPLNVLAACGHCEGGQNYIYWACDINHGPPCSSAEACLWESLPAGVYFDSQCLFTYVDAYHCNNEWWVGFTTSRRGVCQSDCSCIFYSDPFEDHGEGTMCLNLDESCTG